MVGILPVRTMAWVQALNFPVSPTTACNDWQHLKQQSFNTASFDFSAVQRQPEGQHFPAMLGTHWHYFPRSGAEDSPYWDPPSQNPSWSHRVPVGDGQQPSVCCMRDQLDSSPWRLHLKIPLCQAGSLGTRNTLALLISTQCSVYGRA